MQIKHAQMKKLLQELRFNKVHLRAVASTYVEIRTYIINPIISHIGDILKLLESIFFRNVHFLQ